MGAGAQNSQVGGVVAAKQDGAGGLAASQANLNVVIALDHVAGGDDYAVLRPDNAAGAQAAAGVDAHHAGFGGGDGFNQCGG